MKLLTGGKDISQVIEKITWSGDTAQVARKVSFTIAKISRIRISRKLLLMKGMSC